MRCSSCDFISFKSSNKCANCGTDLKKLPSRNEFSDMDAEGFSVFSTSAAQMVGATAGQEAGAGTEGATSTMKAEEETSTSQDFELDLSDASAEEIVEETIPSQAVAETAAESQDVTVSEDTAGLGEVEVELDLEEKPAVDQPPAAEAESPLAEESGDIEFELELDLEEEPAAEPPQTAAPEAQPDSAQEDDDLELELEEDEPLELDIEDDDDKSKEK